MSVEKMTEAQIQARLKEVAGWEVKDGKLHRELKFNDFVQAWGFMSQTAILVQVMDHHPEWFNVYSNVTIDLTTHEAGGISERDFELAGKMNDVLVTMRINDG